MKETATARAERIRQSMFASRNGHNGSLPEINTETIMKEWLEALSKIREALYALRKPWDRHRPVEDELDNILFIIETAFSFGEGAAPNDLECEACEKGDKSHMENCEKLMLWNYPEFARTIHDQAGKLNITIQRLISRSFQPLIDNSNGNVRQKVLEQLFSEKVFTSRIRPILNSPEEQKTRIKANKRVKQRELEERDKFVRVAGRKNI